MKAPLLRTSRRCQSGPCLVESCLDCRGVQESLQGQQHMSMVRIHQILATKEENPTMIAPYECDVWIHHPFRASQRCQSRPCLVQVALGAVECSNACGAYEHNSPHYMLSHCERTGAWGKQSHVGKQQQAGDSDCSDLGDTDGPNTQASVVASCTNRSCM